MLFIMHNLCQKNKKIQYNVFLPKKDSEESISHDISDEPYLKYYKKVESVYKITSNVVKKTIFVLLKTTFIFLQASGIYLLWICMHYFSAHLYIKFCVPDTIYGFMVSPFMIATPHCQGLRWIVYNAAGIINNMWILIGTWIYSFIFIFNKDNSIGC